MRIFVVCWLLLISVRLLGTLPARADAPPSQSQRAEAFRAEIARLLAELDSDRYDLRRRAMARLEALAAEPDVATFLSRRIEQVLVMPNTSLEVRKQLERLQRRLPKTPLPPEKEVSNEELDRLVRQLDDDSYGARLAATKRLEWLLGNTRLAYPIMLRLKAKISADNLPASARQTMEPIYERARGAWLTSDPAGWNLAPVSPAQIAGWIEDLASPQPTAASGNKRRAVEVAFRELRDVLARDAEVPKLKAALETRLADKNLTPASAARLKELLELTQPAMVAEYWEGRRHLNAQHLLIGVPSWSVGAERPSHFDRIDDQTAHCVNGQNLSPGDYPVGVAVPHPKRDGALFHLINLRIPRLRMAYVYQSRREQTVRLAELSRRTLDRYLARKAPLALRELRLLEQLDPSEVSRFAGKFFLLVDDQPMPRDENEALTPKTSRHGAICVILAGEGTQEAVPGLLKALEAKRFLPPTAAAPYELPWIAALAIAVRDPWPGVDAWLAGLIDRADPLVQGLSNAPELGATAAAILLKRQEQDPTTYGLKSSPDETLQALGLLGCRFASPESREKVRRWWKGREKRG